MQVNLYNDMTFQSYSDMVDTLQLFAMDNRKTEVTVMFDGEEVYSNRAGIVLTNMVLLRPYVLMKTNIEVGDIPNFEKITTGVLGDHFNVIITEFKNRDLDLTKKSINDMIHRLSYIGSKFNMIRGNTINLYQLIDLANRVPEFKDLLYYEVDENQQISEIEDDNAKALDRVMDLLGEDEFGTIVNLLNCGTAINNKQMGQVLATIGFKPDLSGKVIPRPVNSSFLRGMRDTKDWFTVYKGARKASITNFSQVKKSGYLARKLLILCMDTVLDPEVTNCDSVHPVKTVIKSKDHLKRLKMRHYINDCGEEMVIDHKDQTLIGQSIHLFSPITCNAPDGVCEKCYGELAKTNKDYHIGIVAMLNLTEQITQRLLSAKHLLQTQTDKIEVPDGFEKSMVIDKADICFKDEHSSILINIDDLYEDEYNFRQYVERIHTYSIEKDGTEHINALNFGFRIYLNGAFDNQLPDSEGRFIISAQSFGSDIIGTMSIANNELNASLMAILDLIEKKHADGRDNYEVMYAEFMHLMEVSGLKSDSVHVELIIRNVLRDAHSNYERPDFGDESLTFEDTQILTLSDANINSNLAASLIYERHKKQLMDINIFNRNRVSVLDDLYVDTSEPMNLELAEEVTI